jgi:hypothetical protein
MCPLCLSVAAFFGIIVGRARRRKRTPDPTLWRLSLRSDSAAPSRGFAK